MAGLHLTLSRKYFRVERNELWVGGVPIGLLAETYGTPAFVYDRSVLDRKLTSLREALPARFHICYSVKANPVWAFLAHFVARGCGLEIASVGEFRRALQAGCNPRDLLFAGPGKTEAELTTVLKENIGEIHIESVLEARRVADIGNRLGLRANVALRVNPAAEAEGGAMRMGGKSAPFGVDEEQLEGALDIVMREPSLCFRGIHVFAGTQILDAKVLIEQYRHGIGIARRVARFTKKPLHTLDFGGGLGIPYFAHDMELDLDVLRAGLAPIFAELESDPDFSNTRFVVEPGRFLAGEAGVYVTRINDIKVSRGKKFLILDGGMNHHLAASGNLGQTIKRNFPVALLNKLDLPDEEVVDVVGPLCTPLDTLGRAVSLPKATIGDLFGIFQSGAYALSASPVGFLSHPNPVEVWVDQGRHELLSRRSENEGSLLDPSRVACYR